MFTFRLSTFIFQLINFFILLGVLTWFFYRPLRRMMQQRADDIAARLHDAEERARQAAEERHQFAEQSQRAQAEAEALLANIRMEASQSGQQILERARQEAQRLTDEAHRRVLEQERLARQHLEAHLRRAAVETAASLIREAAGPTVHQSLIQRLLKEDFGTPGDQAELLRQALVRAHGYITVQLAYEPSPSVESQLREALVRLLGQDGETVNVTFQVDASLVAGARILLGTMAIDLNLQHMLDQLSQGQGLDMENLEYGLEKPA